MNKKPWDHRLSDFVITYPKTCLIACTIFCLSFMPGLLDFNSQYDVRIWFRDTDPNIERLNEFERKFGNDENLVILVESPSGIFDKDSIELLQELTEKVWQVPQVIRVDSLTSYNLTTADGDDITTDSFIRDDDVLTPEYLAKQKEVALNHRVLPGYLVSKDGKSAMIFARIVPTLVGSPSYETLIAKARSIVASYKGKGDHRFYITGEAAVNDSFREVANTDNAIILPILFGFVIIALIYIFRSFVAMMFPMLISVLSISMSFGLCFYLGLSFNSIMSILPGILLAISIADSVHVMVSYFQYLGKKYTNKEAAQLALNKNITPTFLTTLSTMIGFFSLSFTDLLPIRQLGILAGTGCLFAWLTTVFIIGPLISMIKFKVPHAFKNVPDRGKASEFSKKCVVLIRKYSTPIVLIFILMAGISFHFGSKVQINSNPYTYFSDDQPLSIANRFVRDTFGGNAGPEFIIRSGKPDGIKDPEFLAKVEKLKNWIDEMSFVNKTIDIIDIIKEMNQVLNGGNKDFYRLPSDQRAVAEQLFLYTMGLPQGMDLNNRMSLDYSDMRMSVLWSLRDTKGWLTNTDAIEDKGKELGLQVESTGKFLLFQRMMGYVVLTFFKSVTSAMFLVAILMMILFRSVRLGLISMIPNVFPLLYGSMFMYMNGITLNIGTSLVASVCLGIAVDDTIHFLSNFYRLKKEGHSLDKIFSIIFTYTGKALIITTSILVTGFGFFIFGDFTPNVHFGILCAFILGLALLVDLIFLPALLMKLERE